MCSSESLQLHTHPCCIHVAQVSVLVRLEVHTRIAVRVIGLSPLIDWMPDTRHRTTFIAIACISCH